MKHLKKLIAIAILLLTMFSCGKDDDTITETQDCELVFISNGLSASDCGLYQYVSDSGVTIKINIHGVITYTDTSTFPNIFTIQFWGTDGTDKGYAYAGLENLNGKHIKDRFGINRTILHPNGLKITLISTGTFPYIAGEDYFTGATIYDGAIVHHIDLVTNHIEYSGNNQYVADNVDANEADGETSTYEVVGTMLYYYNIYTENELGNKIIERVDLGSLNSLDPNQVNDLFDDPRLNHT